MSPLVDLSSGTTLSVFLSGAYMAIFATAGVFFIRYWSKTKEKFFLYFAVACWFLSIERVALLYQNPRHEPQSWCYILRLVAFMFIIFAVWRANHKKQS